MNCDLVTIVEMNVFIKNSQKILSFEDLISLKYFLASQPEAGEAIPGMRGIRKLRWQANQKGKQGGARVIYFFYNREIPVFLLSIYPKSKKEDLTSEEKKIMSNLVNELIKSYGG